MSIVIVGFVLPIAGCGGSSGTRPGQLATRSIETRYLEADYDLAFPCATEAFFTLGFTIKHSDKESGVLVGERVVKNTGAKVGYILLLGVAGALINTERQEEITLFLRKGSEQNRTILRIQELIDGKPKIEPAVVDSIWIVAQRECMIQRGVEIPKELEEKYKALEKGAAEKEEPTKEETETEQ